MGKLIGLKGINDLSNRDFEIWANEQKKLGKITSSTSFDQMDRLYRNQQFIQKYGLDTFKSMDVKQRDQLFQDDTVQEALTARYGKDPIFERLNTLTTEGKLKLLDQEWKTPTEINQSTENSINQFKKDKKKSSGFSAYFDPGMTEGNQEEIISGMKEAGAYQKQASESALKAIESEDNLKKESLTAAISDNYFANLQQALNKGETDENKINELFNKIGNYSRYYNGFSDSGMFDSLTTSEKMKYISKFSAIADKYGESSALSWLDTTIQNYVSNHQDGWTWAGNTLKNVIVGGVAHLMNTAMGIQALTMNPEEAAKFLQGKDSNGDDLPNWANPLYWQGVDQFNTFDANEINKARKNGGISQYQNITRAGEETDFLSWNTANEVVKQLKYYWTQRLLNSVTGGLGGAASKLASKGSKVLGNITGKFSALGTVALSAVGQAEMEGINAFQETLQSAKEIIDQQTQEEANSLVDQEMQSEDTQQQINKFIERKRQEEKRKVKEGKSFVFDEDFWRKEGENLYRKILQDKYYNQIANSEQKQKDLAAAENAAYAAYATTATIDELRGGVNDFVFQKFLFNKGTRKSLGDNGPKINIINNQDGTIATEKLGIWKKYIKPAIKSPSGEFMGEVGDNVINNLGQGLGLKQYMDYHNKMYNPEDYNQVTDNYLSHFLGGTSKALEALYDQGTYYEGFIGALGGGTTIMPSSKGINDGLSKEQIKELSLAEKISRYVNNPILQEMAELNENERYAKQEADAVNKILKSKKDDLLAITELIGSLKNVENSQIQGILEGADEKFSQAFTIMSTLNTLGKSNIGSQAKIYQNVINTINQAAEGNISDELITQYMGQGSNRTTTSREEAAIQLQKNAQSLLDMSNTIEEAYETISKSPNANLLSNEAKQQYVYAYAMRDNWANRLNEINQELSEGSTISRNPIAQYQTKKAYNIELKSQQALTSKLQEDLQKLDSKIEEEQNKDNLDKQKLQALQLNKDNLIDKLDKEQQKLDAIEKDGNLFSDKDTLEETLSEDQILSLNPEQRAKMLNESNLSDYSKEQQRIIQETIKNLTNKSPNLLQKVQDAKILAERIEDTNEALFRMEQHPIELQEYLNELAANRQTKAFANLREKLRQATIDYLDNTSDEELHNVAINTSVAALNDYIQERPNRAPLIEQFKKVAQLREDAAAVINDMDIPTDYKNLLRQSMIDITEGAKTQEEAINSLEDAIDSKEVDDTAKNALNQLLNKMQDLNYQRNATKVHTREVKKRRQEAARKAAETKRRKEQEKEAKDKAEVQQLLDKFDITEEDAETINGDIIGVTDVQSPTKDSNGSATLRVRNGKKTTNKKVTLVNKQSKEQQKVLTPTGEESEVQLGDVESVDLGDLGETKEGTEGTPQEAPKQKGSQPIEDKKEEKKEEQQEGQQGVKEAPYGNETIVDGQVMVTSPTEQQLLSEDTTGKVGTTETPKMDNTSDPSDDPNQTTLKGNKFFGYKGDQLKSKGEQLPNVDGNPNSVVTAIHQWLDSIGARVQDIIDSELNDIIEALKDEGETPKIQFLIVNENGKATQDDKLGNVVFNVIKYTDTVKRIHNSNLGGVIKAQDGQEYLIVGTLGYTGNNQMQSFFSIKDRLKINRKQSGNLNQRFYVDPNMYTQVAQIGRGWITRRLINDDGAHLRTINQLLSDPERNPKGLKLEDLKWGIQMLTQFATVNVSSRNTISPPYDIVFNSGSVFLLVEAANGKLIPIKVEPRFYHEMRDSTIKRAVDNIINNQLLDLNYEVRRKAIGRLVSILSLNERNNILIGSEQDPVVSIKQNGIVVKRFELNNPMFNRAEFIKKIEEAKFRVNITPNSLSTDNYIKLLDEAGCLLVDVAKLGMSNADYSVYPVDNDGKPIIPTTTQNTSTTTTANSDLQKTRYPSVRLFGSNYRLKGGIWYGFTNNKETQINDPRIITQLMYNHRIDQGQLTPIKVEGNRATYILSSDLNNPEVVVRNNTNNSIEVLSNENAVKAINSYQQELEDKRLKDAAEQALKTGNINLEDVNLDDDSEGTQEQKPSSQKSAVQPKSESPQTQEDINKTGDKSLVELQQGQQLTSAESIIVNDLSVLDLIQSKFSELAQEDDLGKIIDFLKQKEIPVIGIQDKNAFIDNIKNCK